MELFDYEGGPGHRGIATSMEAAEFISTAAGILRERVLASVGAAGAEGLTVVEMASREGFDRMSIQPRFSELRAMRRIADSGMRRKNPSNINAIVWTLPEHVGREHEAVEATLKEAARWGR